MSEIDAKATLKSLSSSDDIRNLMLAWTAIAILLDIGGNLLVLWMCCRRESRIKLDKTSIIIIRNLSVADLGYSIYMTAVLSNISARRDLLDERWCALFLYSGYCFVSVDVYLLCCLNINKLATLRYPLRAKFRSARFGRAIVIIVWLSSVFFNATKAAILLATKSVSLTYQSLTYQCVPLYSSHPVGWSVVVMTTVIMVIIPLIATVITTFLLFRHVHRVKGLQKQAITTLLLVSIVFTVSYLPYAFTAITVSVLADQVSFPRWIHGFYQFSQNLININYAANPLIYFATIRSFREVIFERAVDIRRRFRKLSSRVNVRTIIVGEVGTE